MKCPAKGSPSAALLGTTPANELNKNLNSSCDIASAPIAFRDAFKFSIKLFHSGGKLVNWDVIKKFPQYFTSISPSLLKPKCPWWDTDIGPDTSTSSSFLSFLNKLVRVFLRGNIRSQETEVNQTQELWHWRVSSLTPHRILSGIQSGYSSLVSLG